MKTIHILFTNSLKTLLTTVVILTTIEDLPAQTNNNSLDQIAATFLGTWVGEVNYSHVTGGEEVGSTPER